MYVSRKLIIAFRRLYFVLPGAKMDHGVGDGDEEGVSLGEHGAELAGPGVAIAAGDRSQHRHAQQTAAVVVPAERDTAALQNVECRTPHLKTRGRSAESRSRR